MDKINLIIDCDTGLDDMIALIFALNRKEFDIKGIVATYGNQTLDKTLKNTLNCVQALNDSVKVYKGSDKPLERDQITASDFHGESGLEGPTFPPLELKEESISGIDFILETISREKTTIVSIGPLTDLAKVILSGTPHLDNIEKIIIMGSAVDEEGNVTPYAEFNTYADPEAADIVYSSNLDIVLMSLDVTHQIFVDNTLIPFATSLNNQVGNMIASGLDSYIKAYNRHGKEIAMMHDPSCIAYLLDPTQFSGKKCKLRVNTDKESKYYGKSNKTEDDGNILLIKNIKSLSGFWDTFKEGARRY